MAMNCYICHRAHHATKLPFLCTVDARNVLYEARLDSARVLMQQDDLARQVDAALSRAADGRDNAGTGAESKVSATAITKDDASARVARADHVQSEKAVSEDRTMQIIAQADRLRAEIEATRAEIERLRGENARKLSDLETITFGLASRRNRQMLGMEASRLHIWSKWCCTADNTASTRAFLCEEAARLYGLRQTRKGSAKRFEIGGVEIVDLHAMNGLAHEVISTSLAHVAHILVLASHYMGVRLPAEVTLPHAEYPRPTIFSLDRSYRHGEVSFPGSALPAQLPGTVGLGEDEEQAPRSRPLFIEKSLPTLAKEDPSAYSLFLEGAALLAYNIAWACCSQGVSFGDPAAHDDVCNIGANLYRLLRGDQLHRKPVEPTFPPPRALPGNGLPPQQEQHQQNSNGDAEAAKQPQSMMGRWSHGTTYAYLGGAEGSEFVRNFKILSPVKLADRLKKRLATEAPMLEWDEIDAEEARDGEHHFDDAVLVKGHRSPGDGAASGGGLSPRPGEEFFGVESIMTVRAVGAAADGWGGGRRDVLEKEVPPSTGSGWTKLKSRQ